MAKYSIFSAEGKMPAGCEPLRQHNVAPGFLWALGLDRGYLRGDGMEIDNYSVNTDSDGLTIILEHGEIQDVVALSNDKARVLTGNTYNKSTGTTAPLMYDTLIGATATWACLIAAFQALDPQNEDAVRQVLSDMEAGSWSDFEKSLENNSAILDRIKALYDQIVARAISRSLYGSNLPVFGKLKPLPYAKNKIFAEAHSKDSEDYCLTARFGLVLSEEEKNRIPKKEDWFVMPEEGYEIMDEIVYSKDLRNYWLIGKAGTGKTELAKQIAANLGLPYVFVNCGSGFDDAKIRGQFIPNSDTEEPADSELVSYVDSLSDTDFVLNADTIAEKISAVSSSLSDIISRIVEIRNAGSANRPEFLWQDSPIVYAYSRPCVCEVQEADCIRDPGVLTNFNSILECGENKFIQLDNGKILRKNPYCIYIFTSNMQYEGCRMINNAVFDRLDPYRLDLPSKQVRAQRVMKRTGFGDKNTMTRMVEIVDKIDEYMTENALTTGVCGMRSLEHWAEALMIWQKKHPGEEIPEDVLEDTGARKVLAKTAQPEDELNEIEKVWYGLFHHDA